MKSSMPTAVAKSITGAVPSDQTKAGRQFKRDIQERKRLEVQDLIKDCREAVLDDLTPHEVS